MTTVDTDDRRWRRISLAVLSLWAALAIIAAEAGWLLALPPPAIALVVAATIALPVLAYTALQGFRAHIARLGLMRLTAFHIWRVPAALLFFWYGAQGLLPPLFWILSGTGDLLAGLFAAHVISRPAGQRPFAAFHLFGFADFILAVGTGLAYTLLDDQRMATVAQMPMALIPFFGVGISGASHLMAFHLLRREGGARLSPAGQAG